MSQHRPTETLVNCLLVSRYIIKEFVGGGSNGSFHYGLDTKTKQLVGIKFESKHMPNPQLLLEFQFYRILQGVRFIPNLLLLCPATSQWNALVLELQGPTLCQMRDKCGGTFSLLTTTKIMIQLLNIFEYVHDHGILYRDVKPENFLEPLEYERYLTTVKALQFTQRPPYRKLVAQFRHVLTRLGTSMGDQVFDWDMSHHPKQDRM